MHPPFPSGRACPDGRSADLHGCHLNEPRGAALAKLKEALNDLWAIERDRISSTVSAAASGRFEFTAAWRARFMTTRVGPRPMGN
jgi:hypothetical protein